MLAIRPTPSLRCIGSGNVVKLADRGLEQRVLLADPGAPHERLRDPLRGFTCERQTRQKREPPTQGAPPRARRRHVEYGLQDEGLGGIRGLPGVA